MVLRLTHGLRIAIVLSICSRSSALFSAFFDSVSESPLLFGSFFFFFQTRVEACFIKGAKSVSCRRQSNMFAFQCSKFVIVSSWPSFHCLLKLRIEDAIISSIETADITYGSYFRFLCSNSVVFASYVSIFFWSSLWFFSFFFFVDATLRARVLDHTVFSFICLCCWI